MDQITVNIATPNGVYTDTYPNTAKVEDIVADVVNDRNLQSGDVFELYHGNQVLQPTTRPLVSFGLKDTVRLELVATGSGV